MYNIIYIYVTININKKQKHFYVLRLQLNLFIFRLRLIYDYTKDIYLTSIFTKWNVFTLFTHIFNQYK
jgi:hypothetical protein